MFDRALLRRACGALPIFEADASILVYGRDGVVGAVRVEVGKKGDHAEEARDGEDVDRRGSLLLDVDLPLCDVIAHRQCLSVALAWPVAVTHGRSEGGTYGCNTDPGW